MSFPLLTYPQQPSHDGASGGVVVGDLPLGMWTCLRIVYWQERGLSIDLPSLNRWAGNYVPDTAVWNNQMQAFEHFPWGLPDVPRDSIDQALLSKALQLLVNIQDVHKQIGQYANDVATSIDVARSRDARIEREINLTATIWQSESVKSTIASFTAPRQLGGTCYANACAAAISLANSRIVGRRSPPFEKIREDMIQQFGYDGANLLFVLDRYTSGHHGGRLRHNQVDEAVAREILSSRQHPLAATFFLTDAQWSSFSGFYSHYPASSMPKGYILGPSYKASGSVQQDFQEGGSGHAVLAINVDEGGNLVLLNSWGTEWGNRGTFKVENASVLNLQFHHVYFLEQDLTNCERNSYRLTANYIYTVQKLARGKTPGKALTQYEENDQTPNELCVPRLLERLRAMGRRLPAKEAEEGYEIIDSDEESMEESSSDEDDVSEFEPESDSDDDSE